MAWNLSKVETQEGSPSEPLLVENESIQSSPRRNNVRHVANIALLVAVSIVSFSIGYWIHAAPYWETRDACRHRRPSDIEWTSKPAVIPWSPLRLNGTLYAQNKFRGEPSARLDSEWDRFTTNAWMVETAVVLNISMDEVRHSSNDDSVETLVRLDHENGEGYMGSLELFHQLHCLNILRKWTYLDYYQHTDPFFMSTSSHRREHTDHCIDIIRQVLMCNGDMGLIMFHWVQGMAVPTPDFSTLHSCRDPEAILQWAFERQAPINHPIERIPGQQNLSSLP